MKVSRYKNSLKIIEIKKALDSPDPARFYPVETQTKLRRFE
jgi:hypothetical protein